MAINNQDLRISTFLTPLECLLPNRRMFLLLGHARRSHRDESVSRARQMASWVGGSWPSLAVGGKLTCRHPYLAAFFCRRAYSP
jgi:hypothetical protein